MQHLQKALKLVLLHITDTEQLCRLSCCSQDLKQSVTEAVKHNLSTRLPTAVRRHSRYGWSARAPVNWLCRTAGAAAVGSPDVVRAVLLGLDEVTPEVAQMLAPYGEKASVLQKESGSRSAHKATPAKSAQNPASCKGLTPRVLARQCQESQCILCCLCCHVVTAYLHRVGAGGVPPLPLLLMHCPGSNTT